MNKKLLTPVRSPDEQWTNDRGNTVKYWSLCGMDIARYHWDFGPCSSNTGWKQYDTHQDAWYFGMWVHSELRQTLTFAEGDLTLVECPDAEHYKAELANAAEFYGEAPPAAVGIDLDGTITKFYDERPTE